MSSFKRYVKYLLSSPKLYKIYHYPQNQPQPQTPLPTSYTPSILEQLTDATITYILPFSLVISIYQRRLSYLQLTILIYIATRLLRSISRLTNPDYIQFINALERAIETPNPGSLDDLRSYDFEFKFFPVLYTCDVSVDDYLAKQRGGGGVVRNVLGWILAHSLGIRLIYPGLILGGVLKAVLLDARSKLILDKGGLRLKISAGSEGGGRVDVDGMFFDRRNKGGKAGGILVLCCEGNAGFYEIGMLGGALSEGYSVLGWNHPGFGGSTGTPYPPTELTAALGMMDYAINELGFKESDIVVYGWSIGGFPATYLASKYPDIRGLLLDATFDHILPLALTRMPEIFGSLVVNAILNHVNLDNAENLTSYKGPIRIIRRVDDEIIADPPGILACNRGNNLLAGYVLQRYGEQVPESVRDELVDWINTPHDTDMPALDCLSGDTVDAKMREGVGHRDAVIAMASSILRDYKTTHCNPLPREYYRFKINSN